MDFALLVSAFGFGIRHGFDWDHIAAISGIATGEKNPRKAFSLATAYAVGHAAVVFCLVSQLFLQILKFRIQWTQQ
jgi:high-affinity nickel permease